MASFDEDLDPASDDVQFIKTKPYNLLDGLYAWWSLNGHLNDSTGLAPALTWQAASAYVAGMDGRQAADISSGSYLLVPNTVPVASSHWFVSMWIYALGGGSGTGYNGILSMSDQSGASYNTPSFNFWQTSTNMNVFMNPGDHPSNWTLPLGTWHHVILASTPSEGGAQTVTMFLNGAGGIWAYQNGDKRIRRPYSIGSNSTWPKFSGFIQDVAYFRREIRAQDVEILYNGGKTLSYEKAKSFRTGLNQNKSLYFDQAISFAGAGENLDPTITALFRFDGSLTDATGNNVLSASGTTNFGVGDSNPAGHGFLDFQNPPTCYLSLASSLQTPDNNWSVRCIVKMPAARPGGALWDNNPASGAGDPKTFIDAATSNKLLYGVGNTYSTTGITPDTWTDIFITCNSTTTTYYMNGVSVGTASPSPQSVTKLSIGHIGIDIVYHPSPSDTVRFAGKMQEFTVWKRCLTPTEVAAFVGKPSK